MATTKTTTTSPAALLHTASLTGNARALVADKGRAQKLREIAAAALTAAAALDDGAECLADVFASGPLGDTITGAVTEAVNAGTDERTICSLVAGLALIDAGTLDLGAAFASLDKLHGAGAPRAARMLEVE